MALLHNDYHNIIVLRIMILHPFHNDADYHQTDAIVAMRRGFVEKASPWCECKKQWPGIVTCSRCGRMRMPKRENQPTK